MDTTKVLKVSKININPLRQYAGTVIMALSKSFYDMIVTVAVTAIALTYIFQIVPPVYANTIPGLYIFGMMIALCLRVVKRFDDSYTNDELAERIIELEAGLKEQLDTIIRNQYPL